MSVGGRRLQQGSAIDTANFSADFYVDPESGSDTNPGDSTAEPVATIAKAYALASGLASGSSLPIVIALRGGVHRISTTLQLNAMPSNVPVTILSYPGERPIIDGSTVVPGFTETTVGGVRTWEKNIGANKTIRTLYVDTTSRPRTRLPESCNDALNNHSIIDRDSQLYHFNSATSPSSPNVFYYDLDNIDPEWANPTDIDVLAAEEWHCARSGISSIDGDNKSVTVSIRPDSSSHWDSTRAYFVENVKEALHLPGQWYYDRPTGVLTYLPLSGETLSGTTVSYGTLRQLITINGAKNLTLSGLTITGSTWDYVSYSAQGGAGNVGAVAVTSASYITVTNCTIHDVGEYGIELVTNVTNSVIEKNTITRTGSCGVALTSDSSFSTNTNTVSHNTICYGGMVFPTACGILSRYTHDTTILNNLIHDFFYTGISVGWTWDFTHNAAGNNLIDGNTVYNIGRNFLSDMGGIYMLGRQPGTVISNNVIHDVDTYRRPGVGLYFDQGSSHMTVQSNLIYGCREGIWAPNDSASQEIMHNIVTDNMEFQIGTGGGVDNQGMGSEGTYRMNVHNNIISSGGQALFKIQAINIISDNNLLWNFAGNVSDIHRNQPIRLQIKRKADAVTVASIDDATVFGSGNYVYTNLPNPVVLDPNTVYYMLASVYEFSPKWHNSCPMTTTSAGQILSNVYLGSSKYNESAPESQGFGPVNFKYDDGGTLREFVTSPSNSGTLRNDIETEIGFQFETAGASVKVVALGIGPLSVSTQDPWWSPWQSAGNDTNSVLSDPEFVGRLSQDYSLESNSPAYSSPVNF